MEKSEVFFSELFSTPNMLVQKDRIRWKLLESVMKAVGCLKSPTEL